MKKKIYQGKIIDLSVETVVLPNGATVELELIAHPGASAVVPLKDNQNVVMIRQYRHAVGGYIYEIPAGKLYLPTPFSRTRTVRPPSPPP